MILSAQGKQGNFLVALSRADGHTLWKNALDNPSNSFGQPLARKLAGASPDHPLRRQSRDQLPATGRRRAFGLWKAPPRTS